MADQLPLESDPEMLALLDSAKLWLDQSAVCASMLGITTPEGIASMMPRLHTGYAPEAQRRAARHGLYVAGIRKAPRRETAADKAKAEAVRWGLAS